MNKFAILFFAFLSQVAIAQNGLLTQEQLMTSFGQNFIKHKELAPKAFEKYPEIVQEQVALNTVTPQELEETVAFAMKAMERQHNICTGLQVKYPKSKNADCASVVVRSNGQFLENPALYRHIKGLLVNKEAVPALITERKKVKLGLAQFFEILRGESKEKIDVSPEAFNIALATIASETWYKEALAAAQKKMKR